MTALQAETVQTRPGIKGRLDGLLESVVPDVVTNNAKIFLTGALVNGFSNGVINAVLQLYLVAIGFNGQQLGSIFMVNALSCSLLSIPGGILADRYGKKKMMVLSLALMMSGMILLLTSSALVYFQLAFLFIGAGNACFSMFTPLYSSFFEKHDMEKAFGLYGLLNIMSMSLGSLVGYVPAMLMGRYLLSDVSSYRWVMVGAGFLFTAQYEYLKGEIWKIRNHSHRVRHGIVVTRWISRSRWNQDKRWNEDLVQGQDSSRQMRGLGTRDEFDLIAVNRPSRKPRAQ